MIGSLHSNLVSFSFTNNCYDDCPRMKLFNFIDKESFDRSEEAKNWTEAMEMEIILSVFFLAMTFLTSASILFNLQKTDKIEKGEDVEINEMEVLGN